MQGNPKVIEYLNRALRHELTAVNQYWLHYRLLDNWGYKTLAKRWRKESIEEMQHADKIIEHIIFLDNPKFVGRHGTLQRKATLSVPQKNAARRRICKMVRGWRSKSPRPKDQGLCGTRLPRSTYWGDFLPGARHFAFSMQFASWAQMPDYRKRYAPILKRPFTLIGKGSCPSQV
jgi:Ferritin-like domain